jgi:4-amino-4-deoxy-L-arabinose transferase-like glycosyltransferase
MTPSVREAPVADVAAPTGARPQSRGNRPYRRGPLQRHTLGWIAAILSLFLLLRGAVWWRTVLLEDMDSVQYLYDAMYLGELRLHLLTPDTNPVYPLATALLSLLPLSGVAAARLASVLFSVLLFGALLALGLRIARRREVLVALFLLSVSPILISLGISVLAEPAYLGIVYLGLWLFWTQFRSPDWRRAALLGLVFGLAFLTRVEGLLYLGLLPLLQAAALAAHRQLVLRWRELAAWTLAYATVFVLVATPQVVRVSGQMGGLALNGRQVWSAIVSQPDDRSRDEQLFGLDYSPTELNLRYLQATPEARQELTSGVNPLLYLRRAIRTFDDIVHVRLGRIVGPLFLAFALLGALTLYQRGRRLEVGMIATVLAAALAGPLMQDPLVDRHLAVLLPMLLLLAGIGAVQLSAIVARRRRARGLVLIGALGIAMVTLVAPLADVLRPPSQNWDHGPQRLAGPLAALSAQPPRPDGQPPLVASRAMYIAYFAGADFLLVPYTDLEGLTTFLRANRADYLYLEHKHIQHHPFREALLQETPPEGFELLFRADDEEWGDVVELYRLTPPAAVEVSHPSIFAPGSTARRRVGGGAADR